ncbi:MAG: hypothetical protein NZM12_11720, partial [Steroidobacteraceae bacterium]|nr:hypothetical protein [Steroidobacteraceae bacterium]
DFGTGAGFNLTIDRSGPGNTYRNFNTATDAYNFGPLNYYQRPDRRYTLGAMGHFELSERVDVYTQLMYADNRTIAQIAPSGVFFNTSRINCGNPFLAAALAPDPMNPGGPLIPLRQRIGCTPAQIAADTGPTLDPANTVPFYIGRRNVEGGGRRYDHHTTAQRLVAGVRGMVAEGWNYDVSVQFSRKTTNLLQTNDFSSRRVRNALDVINNASGVPTCRSVINGSDPNCVPYNPFRLGGVTPEALAYLQVPTVAQGVIDQNIYNLTFQGDLEQYGWKLPTAAQGVQFVIGAEYRRDKLESEPDELIRTGDPTGSGGPQLPLAGSVDVKELCLEGRVPL